MRNISASWQKFALLCSYSELVFRLFSIRVIRKIRLRPLKKVSVKVEDGEKSVAFLMDTYALFSLEEFWKNKYFKNQAKF